MFGKSTKNAAMSSIIIMTVSGGFLLFSPASQALAFKEDKNWPCIQRKVLKLSAGQMWRGDPLDTKDTSWQSNKVVVDLIGEIFPRRTSLEETEKIISEFAKTNKENYKQFAEQTFLGLLSETNKIRLEIINGIGKFSSRQKALAKKINVNRKKVDEFEKKDEAGTLTKEEDKKLVELEQTLEWEQRIHEEREQSLDYVCETPVILEQRLFALSKQLVKHYPKK